MSDGLVYTAITDVTTGALDGWRDVDVSGSVPAGAAGVLLEMHVSVWSTVQYGIRKKGSTDNHLSYIGSESNAHFWAAIGIDGDRTFQLYRTNSNIKCILMGYWTSDGATFLTNSVDAYPGATGAWTDKDLSGDCPSAIGVLIQVVARGTTTFFGARKNGSTDSRTNTAEYDNGSFIFIGVDDNQIVEIYTSKSTAFTDFECVGYIKAGATFNTNATDKSLGSTGSYVDIDCGVASDVIGIIMEVKCGSDYKYHLRENGQSDDYYYDCGEHAWAVPQTDEAVTPLIEGKIENGNVDFFFIGTFEPFAAGWTGTVLGVSNPSHVMGVAVADISAVHGVA